MSSSHALGPEHFAYIAAHTRADDAFLRDLQEAAELAGLPAIQVCPEQIAFLQLVLRLMRAREVVEVGTLGGYSAIGMARALPPSGRLRTIEFEPRHAAFAQHWIGQSKVRDRIELIEGRASEVLATLGDQTADLMFVDADKASYAHYLEEGLRIVRPGGAIVVDNALAFGQLLDPDAQDPDVQAIRDFNDRVAAEPRLHAVLVPLGDGMWLGRLED